MRSDPCKLLDTGDLFPPLDFPVVDGARIALPRDVAGHWTVFLVYRGHW